MQECNPTEEYPAGGSSVPMSAGGGLAAAPGISVHIGWIDFPCLEKLMQQATAQRPKFSGLPVALRTRPGTGPAAECSASGWFSFPVSSRWNLIHFSFVLQQQ